MEYQEHYDNMEERNSLCKGATSKGYRMLHDNFDEDWQPGDEPHGTLIFTDEPPEQSLAPDTRDYGAEIDELKAKVKVLKKR